MNQDHYGQTVVGVSQQYDAQLKPLGDLALSALAAQPGERIIDIGCGAAQTCLQLAEAVSPTGAVLGVDRSPVLTDFAIERTRGLPQVEIVCSDAAQIDYDHNTYDALFSRFGVMAFADPVSTFSHLRQALKSGGRLTFVCWRGLQENELDHLPLSAARPHMPVELAEDAEKAEPFSFADPDHVRSILKRAGFRQIALTPHDLRVSAGNIDETLELCLCAGALGRIIRTHADLRKTISNPVREALASNWSENGVFMTGAVWVVTAGVA